MTCLVKKLRGCGIAGVLAVCDSQLSEFSGDGLDSGVSLSEPA